MHWDKLASLFITDHFKVEPEVLNTAVPSFPPKAGDALVLPQTGELKQKGWVSSDSCCRRNFTGRPTFTASLESAFPAPGARAEVPRAGHRADGAMHRSTRAACGSSSTFTPKEQPCPGLCSQRLCSYQHAFPADRGPDSQTEQRLFGCRQGYCRRSKAGALTLQTCTSLLAKMEEQLSFQSTTTNLMW